MVVLLFKLLSVVYDFLILRDDVCVIGVELDVCVLNVEILLVVVYLVGMGCFFWFFERLRFG